MMLHHTEHSRGSRTRRVAGIVAASILCLAGLEGLASYGSTTALPIFAPGPSDLGFRLGANIYVIAGHGQWRITTDRLGHRTVPDSPSGAAGRVHVLGGADAFGWGLSDGDTIAARMQVWLGPGWQVLNEAVPGYGPYAYVAQIRDIPVRDVVVVAMTEVDDLANAYFAEPLNSASCGYLVPSDVAGRGLPCLALGLASIKALFGWPSNGAEAPQHVPLAYNPDRISAARVLRYRIDRLFAAERTRRGAHLIMAPIPWDAAIMPERLVRYLPPQSTAERRVALPTDVDLVPIFVGAAGGGAVFQADHHLSVRGASITARALADEIGRRIEVAGQ